MTHQATPKNFGFNAYVICIQIQITRHCTELFAYHDELCFQTTRQTAHFVGKLGIITDDAEYEIESRYLHKQIIH